MNRPVEPDLFTEHRNREVNLITAGIAVLAALGVVCAMVPGLDDVIGVSLAVAAALTVTAREAARRLRWWRLDRAALRVVAAERARATGAAVVLVDPTTTGGA